MYTEFRAGLNRELDRMEDREAGEVKRAVTPDMRGARWPSRRTAAAVVADMVTHKQREQLREKQARDA